MANETVPMDAVDALTAIRALLSGEWDNPALMAVGELSIHPLVDIDRIIDRAFLGELSPVERARLAIGVCRGLATAPVLQGFNAMGEDGDEEEEEVDGGDAVELLGELWPTIRSVVSDSLTEVQGR